MFLPLMKKALMGAKGKKNKENLSIEILGFNEVIKDFDKEIMLHVISCQILA